MAATPTRIYKIVQKDTKTIRLVRATTKAMAIGFCARNNYEAEKAAQEDIISFMSQDGAKVEDATKVKEANE